MSFLSGKLVAGVAAVAGSVALAVYAKHVITRPRRKKGSKAKSATKSVLFRFLDEFGNAMKETVSQLMQAEAKLRGQNLPPDQVKQYLIQSYFENMQQVEAALLQKHGLNKKTLAEAGAAYKDDEEFQAKVKELRQLDSLLTKPEEVMASVSPASVDISMEDTLKLVEEMMTLMTDVMREAIEMVRGGREGALDDLSMQYAMQIYAERFQSLRSEVFAKYNMNEEAFEAAIGKYQENQEFVARLEEVNTRRKRNFEELGIKMAF